MKSNLLAGIVVYSLACGLTFGQAGAGSGGASGGGSSGSGGSASGASSSTAPSSASSAAASGSTRTTTRDAGGLGTITTREAGSEWGNTRSAVDQGAGVHDSGTLASPAAPRQPGLPASPVHQGLPASPVNRGLPGFTNSFPVGDRVGVQPWTAASLIGAPELRVGVAQLQLQIQRLLPYLQDYNQRYLQNLQAGTLDAAAVDYQAGPDRVITEERAVGGIADVADRESGAGSNLSRDLSVNMSENLSQNLTTGDTGADTYAEAGYPEPPRVTGVRPVLTPTGRPENRVYPGQGVLTHRDLLLLQYDLERILPRLEQLSSARGTDTTTNR